MINLLIYYIKKALLLINKKDKANEIYPYRFHLFQELIQIYGKPFFKDKRFLEIGPKDGDDTERLLSLEPSKYILFDLPDKSVENEKWIENLNINQELIIKNFLYLSQEEYDKLGSFDLIYFTGVLYHNPEQLRFIKKLYDKLNIGGILVLESATIRNYFYRNKNLVQIFYPNTYRDTTTISHLPSKEAIKSWLKMVGFEKIFDSKCYEKENYNVKNLRYACIAEKQDSDKLETYYKKQIEDSDYFIGGST
tara:strand:- start:1537 stop:2289 length:753 start_codon:yes stop_codon:yes gene_type:complete